jgi:hypothetical protein
MNLDGGKERWIQQEKEKGEARRLERERVASASPLLATSTNGDLSSPEIVFSPKITLSAEPSTQPTFPRPPGSRHAPRLVKLGGSQTPQLSLSLPGDTVSQGDSGSPITLLSAKPIPSTSSFSSPMGGLVSGSLLQPDTHAEALVRLVYVFCRVHPQWSYASAFIDIVTPLYLIFAGGEMGRTSNARRPSVPGAPRTGKYAEEETFWAFASLMGDIGDLVAEGKTLGTRDMAWVLERLGRRVRWADERLWTTLCERNLDPATPLYAYRWVSTLLALDLPMNSVTPIWDFIFSEASTTTNDQPKIDLLVDVCTAMLLVVKPRILHPPKRSTRSRDKVTGLWGAVEEDPDPVPRPEDPEEAFVRCLQLLRSYPIREVGGVEAVLQVAFELRQARMVSGLSGDDPDTPGWSERKDIEARGGWAAEKVRQAATSAQKRLWNPSDASPSFSALSSTSSKLLSRYTESVQQSDAAASISKASSNWTASALAKWADASKIPASTSGLGGLGAAAGKFWGTVKASTSREDGSEDGDLEDRYTSLPSTPSRDKEKHPPKFVSPKNTIKYAPGHVPASIAARRERSDSAVSAVSAVSATSAVSTTTLQDRLANLAVTVPAAVTMKPTFSAGPKPLLLSGSARRASNSQSRVVSGRATSPVRGYSSPPVTALSPPQSESMSALYRIGSRTSNGRSPRNSLYADGARLPRGNGEGEIQAAGNKLIEATSKRDSFGSMTRSPGKYTGLAQRDSGNSWSGEIDGLPNSHTAPLAHKWSLADHGAGANGNTRASSSDVFDLGAGFDADGQQRRQSVKDNESLSRKDSTDSQSSASGLGRSRVVKKKFQKRPTSLRLESQNATASMEQSDNALAGEVQTAPVDSYVPEPKPQPEVVETVSIPTPQIGHFTEDDYEHVYEPAGELDRDL